MANYRFSFSYSRWSTWKECPAKYKFKNIDRYPDPPSKAMERGNKVHQDVAKYVAGESEWMPDALKLFTDLAKGLRDLPAHAKMVEEQMAFDRDAKPVTWFGPNAYWRFIWDVGVVGDKVVDSVDWKTGSPRGSYDDQMQIFAIPAYWKYPDLEVFTGHLIYLDSGDSIPYRIDRAQFYGPSCDPASMDGLYGLWVHNVRMMEADQAFPAKPSREACKWCPFHAKKGGPCKDGV